LHPEQRRPNDFAKPVVELLARRVRMVTCQVGRASLVDVKTFLIGLISGFILFHFRINSAWLVLAGAIVGWIVSRCA
jgi:hypothetical protein